MFETDDFQQGPFSPNLGVSEETPFGERFKADWRAGKLETDNWASTGQDIAEKEVLGLGVELEDKGEKRPNDGWNKDNVFPAYRRTRESFPDWDTHRVSNEEDLDTLVKKMSTAEIRHASFYADDITLGNLSATLFSTETAVGVAGAAATTALVAATFPGAVATGLGLLVVGALSETYSAGLASAIFFDSVEENRLANGLPKRDAVTTIGKTAILSGVASLGLGGIGLGFRKYLDSLGKIIETSSLPARDTEKALDVINSQDFKDIWAKSVESGDKNAFLKGLELMLNKKTQDSQMRGLHEHLVKKYEESVQLYSSGRVAAERDVAAEFIETMITSKNADLPVGRMRDLMKERLSSLSLTRRSGKIARDESDERLITYASMGDSRFSAEAIELINVRDRRRVSEFYSRRIKSAKEISILRSEKKQLETSRSMIEKEATKISPNFASQSELNSLAAESIDDLGKTIKQFHNIINEIDRAREIIKKEKGPRRVMAKKRVKELQREAAALYPKIVKAHDDKTFKIDEILEDQSIAQVHGERLPEIKAQEKNLRNNLEIKLFSAIPGQPISAGKKVPPVSDLELNESWGAIANSIELDKSIGPKQREIIPSDVVSRETVEQVAKKLDEGGQGELAIELRLAQEEADVLNLQNLILEACVRG